MPKRSRGTRGFYTYSERAEAGYCKTRTERLGTDVMMPFGFCQLSLKAPRNPVCTPYGHIFEKESILHMLVEQKVEIKKKQEALEAQEGRKVKKRRLETAAAEKKEIDEFVAQERGHAVLALANNETSRKDEIKAVDKKTERKGTTENQWWIKEDCPTAEPAELKEVDTKTYCPIAGKKLKMKDLVPVIFDVADEDMITQGGGRGMYACAVTKKPITHQAVVLLKTCSRVCFASLLDEKDKMCVVRKDKKTGIRHCPVSGKELKDSDIVKLEAGMTGFAVHNETEAKHNKRLVRSSWQMARDRGGGLGAKGTLEYANNSLG